MIKLFYSSIFFFFFILLQVNAQTNTENMVIASGSQWHDKTYKMAGSWKIEQKDGQYYVVLEDNFKTSSGPDLKVFVSEKDIREVGNRDAAEEYSTLVSELKSSRGAQSYKLPESVNIENIKSVLIHCERYSVVWGGFEL